MNKDNSPIIWAVFVTALTGIASLYTKVKNDAVRYLGQQGAFRQAQMERKEAISRITGESVANTGTTGTDLNSEQHGVLHPHTLSENADIKKTNQDYRNKKRQIIHAHGADKFSTAWEMLPSKEKNAALNFSAITSIITGGVTYATANAQKKARKGGKGGKSSNGSCGCGGGCGGHSGHGCGIGCGAY